MRAVHFGAGNIGRGFIGEVLAANGFAIDFVDVSDVLIDALRARGEYEIEVAGASRERVLVRGVSGINSKKDPRTAAAAIARADVVTTAIGPSVLPHIAELIAEGIRARRSAGVAAPLDVIACENMIGGSTFLGAEVARFLEGADAAFAAEFVGFPNAAVDRIVPQQRHDDPLFVLVEDFHEWVVDDGARRARHVTLRGVEYAADLRPFIERKLFTVNTGHASCAYCGFHLGFSFIKEAIEDARVRSLVEGALAETGNLLVAAWGFDRSAHEAYAQKVIGRFGNGAINDAVSRVARSPLRKLGRDERFIRPMRELRERGLPYGALVAVVARVLLYDAPDDDESARLRGLLREAPAADVVRSLTSLTDEALVEEIAREYAALRSDGGGV
jgi:mannitol-1-phosphate 5-dehydrogenase